MKVKLNATEVITYALIFEVEVKGEKCEARVLYDKGTGYEVEFYTSKGELISWPQWAIDLDAELDHSLGYELESAVGGWFQWVREDEGE